jgi:hypothetical protein
MYSGYYVVISALVKSKILILNNKDLFNDCETARADKETTPMMRPQAVLGAYYLYSSNITNTKIEPQYSRSIF